MTKISIIGFLVALLAVGCGSHVESAEPTAECLGATRTIEVYSIEPYAAGETWQITLRTPSEVTVAACEATSGTSCNSDAQLEIPAAEASPYIYVHGAQGEALLGGQLKPDGCGSQSDVIEGYTVRYVVQ